MQKETILPASHIQPFQTVTTDAIPFKRNITQALNRIGAGSVLSVYGRKEFNTAVNELVCCQGGQLSSVQQSLRGYRNKALFDLLLFTLHPQYINSDSTLEELCHCRMLLKPGALLFLLLDQNKNNVWKPLDAFFNNWKKSPWLHHTGFINIRVKQSRSSMVLSGQRPWQRF